MFFLPLIRVVSPFGDVIGPRLFVGLFWKTTLFLFGYFLLGLPGFKMRLPCFSLFFFFYDFFFSAQPWPTTPLRPSSPFFFKPPQDCALQYWFVSAFFLDVARFQVF